MDRGKPAREQTRRPPSWPPREREELPDLRYHGRRRTRKHVRGLPCPLPNPFSRPVLFAAVKGILLHQILRVFLRAGPRGLKRQALQVRNPVVGGKVGEMLL